MTAYFPANYQVKRRKILFPECHPFVNYNHPEQLCHPFVKMKTFLLLTPQLNLRCYLFHSLVGLNKLFLGIYPFESWSKFYQVYTILCFCFQTGCRWLLYRVFDLYIRIVPRKIGFPIDSYISFVLFPQWKGAGGGRDNWSNRRWDLSISKCQHLSLWNKEPHKKYKIPFYLQISLQTCFNLQGTLFRIFFNHYIKTICLSGYTA